MKAYKKVNRKYYKYIYPIWVQPKLTSNSGNPELTVKVPSILNSGADGYKLFDSASSSPWHSAQGSDPWNVDISSTSKICITNLQIQNRSNDPSNVWAPTSVTLYTSDNGTSYTKIGTVNSPNRGTGAIWNASFTTNTTYCSFYRIQFNTGQSYCALDQITITATKKDAQESTEDDYDYYKDDTTYQLPLGPKKEYYKYIDISWTNPSLTSNTTWGTVTKMDNSDNIVSDSNMYKAFNGSTAVGSANTYEFWGRTSFRIKWTMPEKVKVTNIQMWGQNASDTYYSVTGFTAWAWDYSTNAYVQLCTGSYGAEGGTYGSWTVTPIETDIFRFYVAGYPSDPGYRPTALREIKLTGTIKDLRKGDIYKDNYDFYKIVQAPLGINV